MQLLEVKVVAETVGPHVGPQLVDADAILDEEGDELLFLLQSALDDQRLTDVELLVGLAIHGLLIAVLIGEVQIFLW